MKEKSASFFKHKFVLVSFLTGLFLNLSSWLLLIWKIKPSAEPIPLHYTIYFGIDLIGPWQRAYLIPGLGLLFLILNFFLGQQIFRQERVLGLLMAGLTAALEAFLLIGSITLVLINIS